MDQYHSCTDFGEQCMPRVWTFGNASKVNQQPLNTMEPGEVAGPCVSEIEKCFLQAVIELEL